MLDGVGEGGLLTDGEGDGGVANGVEKSRFSIKSRFEACSGYVEVRYSSTPAVGQHLPA